MRRGKGLIGTGSTARPKCQRLAAEVGTNATDHWLEERFDRVSGSVACSHAQRGIGEGAPVEQPRAHVCGHQGRHNVARGSKDVGAGCDAVERGRMIGHGDRTQPFVERERGNECGAGGEPGVPFSPVRGMHTGGRTRPCAPLGMRPRSDDARPPCGDDQ